MELKDISLLYLRLGKLFERKNKSSKAIETYITGIQAAEGIENFALSGKILKALTNVYMKQQMFDEADSTLKMLSRMVKQLDDPELEFYILRLSTTVHLANKEIEKAFKRVNEGIKLAKAEKDERKECDLKLTRAKILYAKYLKSSKKEILTLIKADIDELILNSSEYIFKEKLNFKLLILGGMLLSLNQATIDDGLSFFSKAQYLVNKEFEDSYAQVIPILARIKKWKQGSFTEDKDKAEKELRSDLISTINQLFVEISLLLSS